MCAIANQGTQKSKPRPPPKDNTQHYVAEYLVHGRLDLKDCSSTVALSTLESNDLYKLMPELENAGGFFLTGYAPTCSLYYTN